MDSHLAANYVDVDRYRECSGPAEIVDNFKSSFETALSVDLYRSFRRMGNLCGIQYGIFLNISDYRNSTVSASHVNVLFVIRSVID